MSFKLEEKVAAALTDPDSELWFPQLTHDLAKTGWRRLKDEIGLDKSNYGTARVRLKDAGAVRKVASHIMFGHWEESPGDAILIETLPGAIARHYENSGVDFYAPKQISPDGTINSEILYCLCDALNVIKQVPSLHRTIIQLVKCIHLLKSEADDYDVSFSEPYIPFSIFVSVPQRNTTVNSVRVAEAIIHEAMHLQLTLIEKISGLISSNGNSYYSPWKEEHRTPQGVLHALYVFRVIQHFFVSYSAERALPNPVIEHIKRRNSEILGQIASIDSFKDCEDLTETGAAFAKRLFLEK